MIFNGDIDMKKYRVVLFETRVPESMDNDSKVRTYQMDTDNPRRAILLLLAMKAIHEEQKPLSPEEAKVLKDKMYCVCGLLTSREDWPGKGANMDEHDFDAHQHTEIFSHKTDCQPNPCIGCVIRNDEAG